MLQCFYPDKYITSTYRIDFDRLYRQGYRGIIFDIDNTLVEHGAPADERSVALFARLKELGFRIVLLSNNKEPRVKLFNDAVHVQYIFKAGKPGKEGYQQAMQMMETSKEHTLFIGDQLFTDVWGAKRSGIYSILVQPIAKHEEIQIVLKRYLERIVLASYRRVCKKQGRTFLYEEDKDAD